MLQHAENNTMETGKVKFFDKAKGFGFIKADNGKDIFVHNSGLREDIQENDEVKFEVEEGKKGLNAVNVSLV
ncbi:MAG TPA: cold shock domain-containing protein [Flavobacteriales bacterium]|nr:cold shock domain-containing protein [Flavobacteriales bacterium]